MNEMDIAVKIIDLKKEYRLGVIGGGTLVGDLQSWWARRRGNEDPNTKLGTVTHGKNERFLALDGINMTIRKGERIGIIGHNGAGKSTLLKIFSRVTAPTEGKIYIDGRVSSMLEVGTGFHPELTGRENIYLNGAILGMSRAEVNEKIDQIIEFSECGQFIDTPVKRYSSGMYVKLAFSVSAHLDADILVMDEVLAVGDMKFQQKCLGKMNDVSQNNGKTVLYVSHNMNTIRQLCSRCIVLDHGKLIFDGDVEEAISIYADTRRLNKTPFVDLTEAKRYSTVNLMREVSFVSLEFVGKEENTFKRNEVVPVRVKLSADKRMTNMRMRFGFYDAYNRKVASAVSVNIGELQPGENEICAEVCFEGLVPGAYCGELIAFSFNEYGTVKEYDIIPEAYNFEMEASEEFQWNALKWGSVRMKDIIKK